MTHDFTTSSPTPSSMRTVALLTVLALLPVGLLAASSIALSSRQVTSVVNRQVETTAAVSAVVIADRTANLESLVHSYATRPTMITGLSAGKAGASGVELNLQSLALAIPGISATFIADLAGDSTFTYPLEPAVIGTNFSYRDWYTGLVDSGRPYVSNAIVTQEASHALAITVTDYVRSPNGRPIAILGVNYSLQSIRSFAADVASAQGITLTVTDRVGTSLTTTGANGLVSLAADPRVVDARAGRTGLLRYAPSLPGGGSAPKQLSAYTPVAGTGWTVTASLPLSVAFAGLRRLRDAVLAIAAILVLIVLAGSRVLASSLRRRRESDLLVQSRDRELARVVQSTDESFVSIGPDGAITAWSDQAERLYGWSAADIIGSSMVDTLLPESGRAGYQQDLAEYRAGRESAIVGRRVEMQALHRDGHEIPVEAGVWAHVDGGGFSAFIHDITDRVTIASDLATARDQAMQASSLKSEFLANMSHEIRTPMNGVIGMSGLLLDTDLDAHQRDFAETVCSSAEALMVVIDDILDFSKIEAGKLDVECVPFDLRSVVEEAAVLLGARAQQTGLELTCRVDPAMPAVLLGDPGRLRQVLLNLLGNAVKFTAEGEVNITARMAATGSQADDTVTVELAVRDTGIGMSDATVESLFEAFVQADSSTARRYGGTGLGLAISRQLVELMGGTLSVTSRFGAGTTMTALIPYPVGIAQAADGTDLDLAGVRALIVDDNATNRRVLNEMVSAWGATPTSVDGAEGALVMLREASLGAAQFDVVLLDLNMPDIDGYGLAQMVRSDPSLVDIPMVMLTSSAQRGEAERSKQAGIVAYLTKPIRATQLRDVLDRALGQGHRSPPTGDRDDYGSPSNRSTVTSSRSVLLVEDNVVNQKVFTAMMASTGYRVDVVANGADALDAIDRHEYAVVFMDCQMPVMDGYQTTEQLRLREGPDRHTVVIAVTASARPEDKARCLDAGMDDFLTKPIRSEDIAAKLAHWDDRLVTM